VIWAAIIASLLTLGGVLLTNRGSNNRLKYQLEHDAKEREDIRLMELRKSVYLKSVEAISKNHMILAQMPNLELSDTEVVQTFSRSSATIAKVNLVGSQETVRAMTKLSSELGAAYMKLSAKRLPLIARKTDIEILDDLIEASSKEKDRIIAMMKEVNLQGIKDERLWEVINDNYEFENKQTEKYLSDRDSLADINSQEILEFSRECFRSLKVIYPLMADALVAVRNEMKLPFDGESFKELMEESYKKSEECLEEFISEVAENG